MNGAWTRIALGELCEFQRGLSYTRGDAVDRPGRAILRANNIDPASQALDLTDLKYLSSDLAIPPQKLLRRGSLLVCMANGSRTHLGKVAYVDADYGHAFGSFMGQITPRPGIDGRFLFHALTSPAYRKFIEGLSAGTGINNLNYRDLARFAVPVPPLAEQRRIVALLDAATAAIATAQDCAAGNARRARMVPDARLGQLRGELAAWPQRRLGEVCRMARGGSPRPIRAFLTDAPDGVNWIRIGDASGHTKYIYRTAQRIRPEGATRLRMVHSGDLLLSNSMSFGRPYIMRTSGCIHDGWLVLSEYQSSFDQDFLYLLLASPQVYRQFDRLAAGTTVRNLNIGLAGRVIVPVPPLQVQVRLAAELDRLARHAEALARLYGRKVSAFDALKQSLVHHALTRAPQAPRARLVSRAGPRRRSGQVS